MLGLVKVQKRSYVFRNGRYSGFLHSVSVADPAMIVEVRMMVIVTMIVCVIMIVSVRVTVIMMVISGLLHDNKSFLMDAEKYVI